MTFLSELTGKVVADVNGVRVGRLDDVIAAVHREQSHPRIVALVVKRSGGPLLIPLADVAVLLAPAIALNKRAEETAPYQPGEQDSYLVRDVLDKQLIDTNGRRVVRVNDIELARIENRYYVANVDIGSGGLLRRLGLINLARRVAALWGRGLPSAFISWEDVEPVLGEHRIRLRVSSDRINELHPADLAEIISDLSRQEGSQLLENLDIRTAADTLENVEPDLQASLVEDMTDEKVADVLEEMAPDEAADLLAELPGERSQDILNLMEDDEAHDVRKLLAYPEDSAGGIMTTQYIAISPDLTAEQVMFVLRAAANEAATIYYIFVTDSENHLAGVVSLRDLVLADPRTPVNQFMQEHVVSVRIDASQDEVAQVVAKYNLLAVPVVDADQRLQGIVTADDALDKIIPTAWKKRLPRLYV